MRWSGGSNPPDHLFVNQRILYEKTTPPPRTFPSVLFGQGAGTGIVRFPALRGVCLGVAFEAGPVPAQTDSPRARFVSSLPVILLSLAVAVMSALLDPYPGAPGDRGVKALWVVYECLRSRHSCEQNDQAGEHETLRQLRLSDGSFQDMDIAILQKKFIGSVIVDDALFE